MIKSGNTFGIGRNAGIAPTLTQASSVRIRRHSLVKGDANPFDPEWETYFEARLGFKMVEQLRGKRHITRRIDGGADSPSNQVVVHPNCHRQIHSLGLTVAKAAHANGL